MSILLDICRDNNIKVIEINDDIAKSWQIDSDKRAGAGYAMRVDGETKSYILFDRSNNKWSNRHLVAHELAHVLLGHLSATAIGNETKEQEASTFAAVFTALMLWDEYSRHSREATA